MGKIRKLAKRVFRGHRRASARSAFPGVVPYWDNRYAGGGSSGAGSAGRLAEFKAKVLNEFVEGHDVRTVLELGCGDGAQLELARYPSYVGIDVSQTAIDLCRRRFAGDRSKRFFHAEEREAYEGTYDLVLSLDVIFHLVEDAVYERYMAELQRHAGKYVIIYSSNYDDVPEKPWAPHVRHRKFSEAFDSAADPWRLLSTVDNVYPYDEADPDNTSFADFYMYERS